MYGLGIGLVKMPTHSSIIYKLMINNLMKQIIIPKWVLCGALNLRIISSYPNYGQDGYLYG